MQVARVTESGYYVSELSWIIGHILVLAGVPVPLECTRSGWTPKVTSVKFDVSKQDTLLYHMIWKAFWYLGAFRCDPQQRWTDRYTNTKCCY